MARRCFPAKSNFCIEVEEQKEQRALNKMGNVGVTKSRIAPRPYYHDVKFFRRGHVPRFDM